MQSITQLLCFALALNEFLQNSKFLCATRLDSARIVKNVTRMIGEHEFIIDTVLSPLERCLEAADEKYYHH
jgi:hypothetical protein